MHEFNARHGLAVRAVGITVKNVAEAYRISTENGAIGTTKPYTVEDKDGRHGYILEN